MGRFKVLLLLTTVIAVFYGQAQEKYDPAQGFVAHEWGTFTTLHTSGGRQLTGLQKEEETLPPFAFSLCHCHEQQTWMKGVYQTVDMPIANVTVKMETPVIYFYNEQNHRREIDVSVKFRNGSISQWYPLRAGGEPIKGPSMWSGTYTNDFSNPRTGHIRWAVQIGARGERMEFTNAKHEETDQWVAPRKTESDFVLAKAPYQKGWDTLNHTYLWDTTYNTEKFLFYRGLANFKQPLKVKFNVNGELVLTNKGSHELPFVMVYQKTASGERTVWWTGGLKPENRKCVPVKGATGKSFESALGKFENELVKKGLYRDEAKAMLETWRISYFETVGIKIFWIVPDSFVDEILPLTFIPHPDSVSRVFIGRSEIIAPGFEKELLTYSKAEFDTLYLNDRFYYAYDEFRNVGNLSLLSYDTTDIMDPDEPPAGHEEEPLPVFLVDVFPNPTTGPLYLRVPGEKSVFHRVTIADLMGKEILSEQISGGWYVMDIGFLPSGLYNLHMTLQNGSRIARKIAKY